MPAAPLRVRAVQRENPLGRRSAGRSTSDAVDRAPSSMTSRWTPKRDPQRAGESNTTRTLWLVADRTSASIDIAAKPDDVMAVIIDFEHYRIGSTR